MVDPIRRDDTWDTGDNWDRTDYAHRTAHLGPIMRVLRAVIGYLFLKLPTLKNRAGSLVARPIDNRSVSSVEVMHSISADIRNRYNFIVSNQEVFLQSELLRDLWCYALQIADGINDRVIQSDAVNLLCDLVAKDAIAGTPRLKNIAGGMGILTFDQTWNLTCDSQQLLTQEWKDALSLAQNAHHSPLSEAPASGEPPASDEALAPSEPLPLSEPPASDEALAPSEPPASE